MRKSLREVFGEAIKQLIKDNPHAWWALKKEFDDGGYTHTAFGNFTVPAEALVRRKLRKYSKLLYDEYVSLTGKKTDDTELVGYFRDLIIDEICARADVAARRTIYW